MNLNTKLGKNLGSKQGPAKKAMAHPGPPSNRHCYNSVQLNAFASKAVIVGTAVVIQNFYWPYFQSVIFEFSQID